MSQRRVETFVNHQSEAVLWEYMQRHDVSVTEALRRFVGVAGYIMDAIDEGAEILVRRNGRLERVVFDLT